MMLLKAIRPLRSNVLVVLAAFAILVLSAASSAFAGAQTSAALRAVPDRLVQPVNESARVTLGGTIHPLANKQNDRGVAAAGLKLDRLQIVMKRSDAQEAELKQLISDMHTPGSPSYQKWLTPDEFGKRFGPSDADVAKLESWVQSHGFSISKLNPGRQTLEIAGTAGQFLDTFKAAIHSYQVKGETHFANAAEPQIPAALAPVFGGFVSLNNFRLKHYSRRLGTASYNPLTHESKPDWTIGGTNGVNLVLAPQDFAVQYDLPNQATAGTNDGTGQSIAVVNESNINISLVNRYRALFGLPANPPQIVIDGNDPGINGINNPEGENFTSGEAYLDVEEAGAVAPGATVYLVIGADTAIGTGLFFAAERAVYSNLSPIISLSFGECEADLQSTNGFLAGLWEQAAAQGITVVVSSGDNGSAACDDPETQPYAVSGQAVSGFTSTPYNVAVGGTDFYYTNYAGTTAALNAELGGYWNLTPSNQTPVVSLKKPVPEQPWNDSQFGLDVTNYFDETGASTIAAGSGGKSTLGLLGSGGTYGPYPKPAWQTGTGVPADSARDVPDVSLFASNGSNLTYYPICAEDADCVPATGSNLVQFSGVGGTSASAPAFAGIMALVNQQYGRQGQANFRLYPLAKQFPAAFHDVTTGTITVPCNTEVAENLNNGDTFNPVDCLTLPAAQTITAGNSNYSASTEGEVGLAANTPAYPATTGYDLATGLGTLDVSVLLADWNKVTFGTTGVTLTPSKTTFAHGTAITVSGAVTGTPTPTGDVALMTDSVEPLNQGEIFFTLASGSYNQSIDFLPGGTYNIWGNYGGDASNASSSSIANKVQITVAPEASTTTLSVYTVGSNGFYSPVANSQTFSYGTQMTVGAQPAASTGSTTTYPTGNVAFIDGSNTIDTAVVNGEGDAEFYSAFAPGSHSIKATYSGDPSYAASTSSTMGFTIAADTPTFVGLTFSNENNSGLAPGGQTIIVGVANGDAAGNATVSGNAIAPAGTVALTGAPAGTTSLVTLVPAIDPFTGTTEGIATFIVPPGASGTFNLTFTYTPSNPTYYTAISATETGVPFEAASSGLLTSTTTATASPTAASPASLVAVTSTITGQTGKPAPTGTISIYTADTIFGTFSLPAGSGDSTAITILFDSAGLNPGTNPLSIQYSGDTNYLPSVAVVTVANPLNDFQMVPLTTIISVPSTNTATDAIELTSTNSFAGAVALTCKGAGGVTCSISPASATLTAGNETSSVLSVNTAGVTKTGTYNVIVTGSDSTGNFVHTLGLQVVVPQVTAPTPNYALTGTALAATVVGNSATSTISTTPSGGFTGSVALTCAVSGPMGATTVPTCSLSPTTVAITGTAAVTSALTVVTTGTTTPGSYSVVVTGTSGSITQSVTLPLVVSAVAPTPSFTLTGLANEGATAGGAPTSTVTATSTGGFAGTVALTCAVTGPTGATDVPTCGLAPASVSLATTATSVLTVTTLTTTTAGDYTVTVTGTSGSTVITESFVLSVTVATVPGGIMVSAPAITIASQGASGTSTVTVTPTNGFTGSVAVTCAVTSSPTGAIDTPTCALSPASVSITTASPVTSTLTVNTTAQTTSLLKMPGQTLFTLGGGATLAALFFLGGPIGRRRKMALKSIRTMRILSAAMLFALIASAGIGCGGGSHSTTTSGGTTTGAYIVTLTATPATGTAVTTTVAVTVN